MAIDETSRLIGTGEEDGKKYWDIDDNSLRRREADTDAEPLADDRPGPRSVSEGELATISVTTHQQHRRQDDLESINDLTDSNQSSSPVSNRRRVAIFCAIWTGVFLGAIDSTIVATLISSISSSFGSSNQLSWLATAYLLSISATGALYGKFSDLMGRRVASLTALSLFTIGTIGCSISSSMNQLIISRFVAGCGGGGIMTTSSIIATDLVRLDQRALIQGFANLCYGIGGALGGPLGGWLNDSFGWRIAFIVQVPILLLAMGLVGFFVNYKIEGQVRDRFELLKRIDLLGSFTFIFTVTSFLLSLSFKNNLQCKWSDPRVYISSICFVIGLKVFIYVESYTALEPVLPIRLLRLRTPLCSVLVNCLSSVLFNLPLWFETVKLTTATHAGLHLIPNSISLSVGSLAAGAWIRSTGCYKNVIVISCFSMVIGAVLLRFKLDDQFHEWIDVIPNGLGFTAITTAVLIAMIATIPSKDMAVATGVSYLFRYIGQVSGVALSGSILQANLAAELRARITGPGSTEIIERIRHQSSSIKYLQDDYIKSSAIQSYKIGLKKVFEFDLMLSILSLMISFGIKSAPIELKKTFNNFKK
ncbi:major facilitator superfamily domain-containing protein [Phakopsora pachyrhizi]|uniref:Major facilitator superfamily domain-containing protein n=1 Tax=Phakopsora pachyrhizi TaxID=170000 RepID=A0AAV0B3A4_PHAPC|nr:major facilitator superfamily domain-containing protein [Phakopsora pachyrhizi]